MTDSWQTEGERVLRAEGAALLALADRLDRAAFVNAVELLHRAPAPVVVTGMGKSGHIAAKVAATLASTGTPAFRLHPGEALHGDLGMVPPGAAVLAFSQSGATEEVTSLLPYFRSHNNRLVAVTGNARSPLGEAAEVLLLTQIDEEACPHNLAPTTSTTAQLALGDALAMALMRRRGFGAEDFAIRHPLGALGRRLLMKVEDVMKRGDAVPFVTPEATLQTAVDAMNRGRLGCIAIVDAQRHLLGIFTDGDLRRLWVRERTLRSDTPIGDVMIRNPKRVQADTLGVKAVDLMEDFKITVLPAVDADGRLVGMVHLHDLVALGIAR